MRSFIALVPLLLALSLARASQIPSYFHSTEQLNARLEELQHTCKHNLKLETILSDPKIYTATISKGSDAGSKQKVFYLFGEHARELISPEAGLNLINVLCGFAEAHGFDADAVLDKSTFQIVLNANPISRSEVLAGDYCKRTNEDNVDLNRNWDAHWEIGPLGDTYPGTAPFSEKESVAVKNALTKFGPKLFATIHSGTLAMFTPYAYSADEPVFNENKMLDILAEIDKKYCNCEYGAAGAGVGYLSPGTCLDYAYDKLKIPYTFAFEIYSEVADVPAATHATSFLQINKKSSETKKKIDGQDHAHSHSCFVQTGSGTHGGLEGFACFEYFNPSSQEAYNLYVDNWTKALLELAGRVHEKEAQGQSSD